MRLSSVRLSGFKSFVDNTQVLFPSQLVGVVGPNGCGKSNIIDAVRWVLGESSAKNLRGGQISDVIFNGSNTRPASSQASIELNFENARGKLRGDFTRYNEISVRRSINSEGVSSYYINKIRCRRKDIVDTFLGTGLGPRSYSIIQQGTISRLVEAKPEELRQYLEEAAGISHYKERRRETESRMKATRENLERLVDLCDELGKRLRTLSTQAKNAQIYKELSQKLSHLQQELLALQWRELEQKMQRLHDKNQSARNKLEAHIAKLRTFESIHEAHNQEKHKLQTEHQQAQQAYYTAQEAIARMQEQIQSLEQRHSDLTQEQQEIEQRKQGLLAQQATDQAELSDVTKTIDSRSEQLNAENKRLNACHSDFVHVEKDHNELQKQWDQFQALSYDQRKQSEVDQYKIQETEQRIERNSRQLKELNENIPADIARLDNKRQQQQQANASLLHDITAQKESLQQAKQTLVDAEAAYKHQNNNLHEFHRQQQVTEGTIASLTTLLNQKTESGDSTLIETIRQQYGLGKWIDQAQVRKGWENAIETSIPQLISMHVGQDASILSKGSHQLQQATTSVVIAKPAPDINTPSGLLPCADIITGAVPAWLHTVFFAEDVAQALQALPELQDFQRIVCKNGTSLGPNWFIASPESRDDALLVTRQRLRDQEQRHKELTTEITRLKQLVEEHGHAIEVSKKSSEEQQQALHVLEQQRVADTAALKHLDHQGEQLQREHSKIMERKQQLAEAKTQAETALTQVRDRWSKGLDSIKYDDQKRQELVDRRAFLNKQREQASSSFNQLQKDVGELRLTLQQDTSKREYLEKNVQRLDRDINEIDTRLQRISQQLENADQQPDNMHKELQKQLDQQLELQKHMQQRHGAVSEKEQSMKESNQQIKESNQRIEEQNARMQELQLKVTEIATRQQTLLEQLEGTDPKEIAKNLAEEADATSWKNQIQSLERKLQVLGEVNHAAIKDFETEKERKEHLDLQRAEIEKALATLENTISTIDKATKETFRDTFEKVNSNLQELFPQLLGGGTVKLEMTSNDLLTTGVTIIARPPGKRNTSITMLSGGEKAMTAIALVFAIFQLNPAPFCMLDEVDAPLDDVNTHRYISTVKAMMEKVQFIVVTHSKITMEQLDQLIGITMSEAGVSRIVSVDLDKALEMA